MNIDGAKDQVAYFRSLAETRLKELQETKEEKIKIRQEIDQLKVQVCV